MSLIVYTHAASARHLTPPGHPERVERLEAVAAALDGLPGRTDAEAREATREELLRAHPAAYLDALADAAPASGSVALDPDTHMSPGSLEAAARAAGGCCAAVEAVLAEGGPRQALVACRPPGHHAERTRAMGFCLYSTVAIAALHALDGMGLSRVAVADFDVHHGNGTQDVLERDARAVFCSSHESPLFPGTGMPSETGVGNVFNATLSAGDGSRAFREAWEDDLLPAIDAQAPELILVSAGFDAHRRDPLASIMLDDDDFAWIAGRLADLAATHCGGRVVSTLEGGYDLQALEGSLGAYARVMAERAA